MLIEQYLPCYDVTEVHQVEVDAPPHVTYEAIRRADLGDPLISALFSLRELPNRLVRKLNGAGPKPTVKSFPFADMATPEMGFVLLGENPLKEFVVGSAGRFWKRDYGSRPLTAADFVGFREPGYAKLVLGFSVLPTGLGGSVLRYEARTATTDETARKRFLRYWRIIRPGVAIVMRRALQRIKTEAERPVSRKKTMPKWRLALRPSRIGERASIRFSQLVAPLSRGALRGAFGEPAADHRHLAPGQRMLGGGDSAGAINRHFDGVYPA